MNAHEEVKEDMYERLPDDTMAARSVLFPLNKSLAPDRTVSRPKFHHTSKSNTFAACPWGHTLLAIYPIRRTLLAMLSCRDVALLMAVLRLPLSIQEKRRYLSIIRDMPEHQSWIYTKLQEGFTVTLIGKDVREHYLRTYSPLQYWDRCLGKEHLTVWIAVLPGPEMWRSVPIHHGSGMSIYGTLVQLDPNIPQRGVIGFGEILTTLFVPVPGPVNETTYYRDGLDWYECLIPNEHGIRVMYYASHTQLLLGPSMAVANPVLGKLLVDETDDDWEWTRDGGYNMLVSSGYINPIGGRAKISYVNNRHRRAWWNRQNTAGT